MHLCDLSVGPICFPSPVLFHLMSGEVCGGYLVTTSANESDQNFYNFPFLDLHQTTIAPKTFLTLLNFRFTKVSNEGNIWKLRKYMKITG